MSCRHDLANGTCVRCYPKTGKIDPGPEEDYGDNLEGAGAVTKEEYRRARAGAAMSRLLGEQGREELRRCVQATLRDGCGLDVDVALLWFGEGDRVVRITVTYGGELDFEVLSRISVVFGTRKINLSCDGGTGSDPCHQRDLSILDPDVELALAIADTSMKVHR